MKLTKDEVAAYIKSDSKVYDKCYQIFLLTVKTEDEGAELTSFLIGEKHSLLFYNDFEGDNYDFVFPTDWLYKGPKWISKAYKALNDKRNSGRAKCELDY